MAMTKDESMLFQLDLLFDIKSVEEAQVKLKYYKECAKSLEEILNGE
ncbi:hypothetical protein NVP1293O_46 [Vibrio phage 1.293.O._10N.261.52.E1]|nr:hypothetical protein NVP1293O_46 [Vibrio phage 1.293.O._10N.261.52.E1]